MFPNVRLSMILLIFQLYINIYSVYVDMKCLPASSARDFADNFTKIYSPIFFPKKNSEIKT